MKLPMRPVKCVTLTLSRQYKEERGKQIVDVIRTNDGVVRLADNVYPINKRRPYFDSIAELMEWNEKQGDDWTKVGPQELIAFYREGDVRAIPLADISMSVSKAEAAKIVAEQCMIIRRMENENAKSRILGLMLITTAVTCIYVTVDKLTNLVKLWESID